MTGAIGCRNNNYSKERPVAWQLDEVKVPENTVAGSFSFVGG